MPVPINNCFKLQKTMRKIFIFSPEASLITKVRDYFTKKRKGTSRNFNRASRVLEIVAEATGISPIKAFSLAFKEAAAYLTKKERKVRKFRKESVLTFVIFF